MSARTGRRTERCPVCGKPTVRALRPFCSRACADEDLRRWLAGAYRIATDEGPEEGEQDGEEEA